MHAVSAYSSRLDKKLHSPSTHTCQSCFAVDHEPCMELCPLPADREGHGTRNPHPRWSLKAGLWDDYGKCACFRHQKRKVLHSFLVVCVMRKAWSRSGHPNERCQPSQKDSKLLFQRWSGTFWYLEPPPVVLHHLYTTSWEWSVSSVRVEVNGRGVCKLWAAALGNGKQEMEKWGGRMGGSAQSNVGTASPSTSIYWGLHHVPDFSRLTLRGLYLFYKERNEWLRLHCCLSGSKLQVWSEWGIALSRCIWPVCVYLHVRMCTNTQVTSRKHNML